VLISGILMPVFLYLAFLMGSKPISMSFLISGLLGMTLFFTSTAVSPVIFPWEGQAKTLERLVSCPISPEAIILGDLIASSVFGIAVTLVALIIGLGGGGAIGILLSVPPTAIPQNIMLLSTLVKFPLIFISGIFMPVDQLPPLGQILALISPLTYFTDIVRFSYTGAGSFPICFDLGMLLVFTIILIVASVVLHKKTMPLRI